MKWTMWLRRWMRYVLEEGYAAEKNLLKERVSPGADWLDAACGEGELTASFHPGQYWGVDSASQAIHRARSTFPQYGFSTMDITRLPDRPRFDGILLSKVLHHLDDAQARAALEALVAALHPGGRILVIEPLPEPSLSAPLCYLFARLETGHHRRDTGSLADLLPAGTCLQHVGCLHKAAVRLGVWEIVRP